MMTNPAYTAALDLADSCVPVFPCGANKSPACDRGHLAATLNPSAGFWSNAPLVGMPTGVISGLDILDIDPRDGGDVWLKANAHRLPLTRRQFTRSGGVHLYFLAQPGLRPSASKIAPGVDVRATGGYVIRWDADGLPVDDAPVAAWPAWLLAELATPTRNTSAELPTVAMARLAAPSVEAVVGLLGRLPNPITATRDTYTRVMLGAVGAMQGLAAVGVEDGAGAIRGAAIAWAERWEGGSEADETAKWDDDFATRRNPLAGWQSLEAVAAELMPAYRVEVAAAEFGTVPLPIGEVQQHLTGSKNADSTHWQSMLLLNDKGTIKPLVKNAMIAFEHAPVWSGVIALNTFANTLAFRSPPPWHGPDAKWKPRDMDDADMTQAAAWLQVEGMSISTTIAREALIAVAKGQPWHPVREYFAGVKWDGRPRADTWLCDYMGAEDTELNRQFASKFLISVVARVMKPGCKVDTMPIFEGAQGLKKSTASLALCHDPAWFVDHMPDLHNKDAMQQIHGVLIAEMAELDTIKGAEASRAKAFLSTAVDRFRAPYGFLPQSHPRQTVFVGTVNPGANGYLGDETGNRRYWPIHCGVGWPEERQVDAAGIEAARDQLWAEAYARYQAGEAWWLDTHKAVKQQQAVTETRETTDVWGDAIGAFLAGRDDTTIDAILSECIGKSRDKWTRADQTRVGTVLTKLKWTVRQLRVAGGGGARERRYFKPEYDGVTAMRPNPGPVLTTGCDEVATPKTSINSMLSQLSQLTQPV